MPHAVMSLLADMHWILRFILEWQVQVKMFHCMQMAIHFPSGLGFSSSFFVLGGGQYFSRCQDVLGIKKVYSSHEKPVSI